MDRVELLRQQVLNQLQETNCIKTGEEVKLKSGIISDVYIDLRLVTCYRSLILDLIALLEEFIPSQCKGDDAAMIVGVPYGVVPLAVSVAHACGMLYYPLRKEIKEYGKASDSKSFSDRKFIVIEDVMSTGSSIIETIKKLEKEDKEVTKVIALVDRQLGGKENIKAEFPKIEIQTVFTLDEITSGRT